MATIENKTYVRDKPAVEQQDIVIPLDVTPVVTTLVKANVIDNDQSLVAATGDPTLRPLADYLAMIFTMGVPDTTAPTVSSYSPADNATGVSRSTDLVATMSETVTLGASGVISLKKTSDNSVIQTWNVATQSGTGAGQVSVVGNTGLTMRLTSTLAATTEHYVVWDAGVVKDASSNSVAALSATTTWSFTTGTAADTTAPTVSSFSPADNATGIAITTNLVATMSETVVLGASGVITLKKTSDNSTVDSWNVATASGSTAGKVEVVGGTALTMHLTASLANNVEYYVIWDAGVVVDTSANPVAVQSSTTPWSFTTVAGTSTAGQAIGLLLSLTKAA